MTLHVSLDTMTPYIESSKRNDMRQASDLGARELTWVQPERKVRAFTLQGAEGALVSIRWDGRGARAVVEAADGQWIIDRRGMMRPHVSVRTDGGETDLAVFHGSRDGGGRLELRDGRIYAWNNTNWRHTAWAWTDRSERLLLRFKGDRMTIEAAGTTVRELPLLVALSWYLNIM